MPKKAKSKQNQNGKKDTISIPEKPTDFELEIFKTLDKNIKNFKKMMDSPADLVCKEIQVGGTSSHCAIVFIDGLSNGQYIAEQVINTILTFDLKSNQINPSPQQILTELQYKVLPTADDISVKASLDEVSLDVLSGNTAIFIDGSDQALVISSKEVNQRSLEEPITEALIRGPRIGFIEDIRTNTTLVRRGIRDPNLRIKSLKLGRRSKSDAAIMYIEGIANTELVKEVVRRLESIDTDDVPETGFIEQWIEDSFLSPFPQVQHTERPDRVRAALIQGRVAILLDNTPFVLIVPVTIGQHFHTPEDYYERWLLSTLVRVLRYVAAFISVFLPGLYVALVSYQPGMIPTALALSIAGSREGVPFPATLEAILMGMTMEILQEAGLRLPKPIGQTVGVVGGLVIGDAAVAAGIVSPIMVIVIALTAIASFALPSYSIAISLRILRFANMFAASLFGIYGLIMVYIMINVHFVNLKSFGVPYSTPYGPLIPKDMKDLVLKVPMTFMKYRPHMFQPGDKKRMGNPKRKGSQ
ncbi:spore germination protein [Pullulanibacillus camelliae]|uniref:spore germination protein n=1 Tax=Pullulanibacillus camelliae TaxID=1707096 RepID=UPI001E4F81EA|nr:spore germination protein [Pullulanibacillus camelliae]